MTKSSCEITSLFRTGLQKSNILVQWFSTIRAGFRTLIRCLFLKLLTEKQYHNSRCIANCIL